MRLMSIRKWSFGAKLAGIIMLASTTVVLLASGAIITVSVLTQRRETVDELKTLADVTGQNCIASLSFNIPEDAESVLASLDAQPSVTLAVLYGSDGNAFSVYRKRRASGPAPPPLRTEDGHTYRDGHLEVFRPIETGGRIHGFLCLVDDLSLVRASITRNTTLMVGFALIALGIAYLLATRLQAFAARPILALTETARHVSDERDYSVRATGERGDEIGVLISTFNQMLAGIEARETALRQTNRTLQAEIRERRQAQWQLQQLNQTLERRVERRTRELKRSNEELERFAYVASHDLQEPLRTIANFAKLIERRYKGKLDQDADEFIGFLTDAATRSQALINDLLEFSRVGTRGKPFQQVDCERLINDVCRSMRAAIRESGADIQVGALPAVRGDPAQLSQLFQNLIGNAIKFAKPGTTPVVRIDGEPRPDSICISVRDNGIGIDSKYFERIFVLFRRLDGSKYPGTGIGLAICKKIVERHGGRLWVDSEPGRGSTFRLTLPPPESAKNAGKEQVSSEVELA